MSGPDGFQHGLGPDFQHHGQDPKSMMMMLPLLGHGLILFPGQSTMCLLFLFRTWQEVRYLKEISQESQDMIAAYGQMLQDDDDDDYVDDDADEDGRW